MATAAKRYGALKKSDMIAIIREAQKMCSPSNLGVIVGRRRLRTPREVRVACLQKAIRELLKKKLSEMGVKVLTEAPPGKKWEEESKKLWGV